MGYLHFYSSAKKCTLKITYEFSSPMGYLHFYSVVNGMKASEGVKFSSPMGYLHFYSATVLIITIIKNCSRPLWGIYISIRIIIIVIWLMQFVLVPYGVSTFLFEAMKVAKKDAIVLFSSPMGYLHFYSRKIL